MAFALDYPELEKLFTIAGGKFRLTVLLQRRVAELVEGSPRLVRLEQKYERDYVRVAVEELKQGKIKLAADNVTIEKMEA
jgi:DNA-directed RNA polymerase subunit K/omega